MQRPTPKELVIKIVSPNTVCLNFGTDEAKAWVETEAPNFGVLLVSPMINCYTLVVSDLYDCAEVAVYLASFSGTRAPSETLSDSDEAWLANVANRGQ
jgi:hypothetical protein